MGRRVAAGVVDCVVEMVEQMPFVREPVERPDSVEDTDVAVLDAGEQHRDVSVLEFFDDLAERVRAGCVEDLDLAEPQDDDLHVGRPQ